MLKSYCKREVDRLKAIRDDRPSILKGCGIYIFHLITIHSIFWIMFRIYSSICVPSGITGFFVSFIYHGSFACTLIYAVIDFARGGIYSMVTHILSTLATVHWMCYKSGQSKKGE